MKIKYILISFFALLPSLLLSQTLRPEPVEPDLNTEHIDSGYIDQDIGVIDTPNVVTTDEKEPDPSGFILLEEEPKAINLAEVKAAIPYPNMWHDIEGKLVVRVLVDEAGNYAKHIVLKSPHAELTEVVVEHLQKLKFTPGIQGGKPIPVWLTIPFDFSYEKPRTEEKLKD